MRSPFQRTETILGEEAMRRLKACHVALFGLGGVGGYACEALVRSGIGSLTLVDSDRFHESNLNRQLLATRDTLGRLKTDIARERVLSINPDCRVETVSCFFLPETADRFDFSRFDYVIDAIDTVTGKLTLIEAARAAGTPIISCMGTGNKLDPTKLCAADIYETSVCPLARIMRKECQKRGIRHLKVVYSTEKPLEPLPSHEAELLAEAAAEGSSRRSIPGSAVFVPAAAGLLLAREVICDLIGDLLPALEAEI